MSATAALVLTLTVTVTPAGATSARPSGSNQSGAAAGPFTRPIKNLNSNRCMAIPGGDRTPGVGVIQFDCHGPSATEQTWVLTPLVEHVYTIRNVKTGLCLAIPNGDVTPGARAIQWNCNNGQEQLWITPPDDLHIINGNSGLCLAIPSARRDNSAPVIQWTCDSSPTTGNPEQDWDTVGLKR